HFLFLFRPDRIRREKGLRGYVPSLDPHPSPLPKGEGVYATGYSLPAFACPPPPSPSRKRMLDCHRSAQSFPPIALCLSRSPLTWECECSRDSEVIEAPRDFHESPAHR